MSEFSIRYEENGDNRWSVHVNGQLACYRPTEAACDEWCERFYTDEELQERFRLETAT